MYVACAAPSEFMELVSICREGGACRYPRLDPLITHIVVRPCIMSQLLVMSQFLSYSRCPSYCIRTFETVALTSYCGVSHSCLWVYMQS